MSHYVGQEMIEGSVGRVEYEVVIVIGGEEGNQGEVCPILTGNRRDGDAAKVVFVGHFNAVALIRKEAIIRR